MHYQIIDQEYMRFGDLTAPALFEHEDEVYMKGDINCDQISSEMHQYNCIHLQSGNFTFFSIDTLVYKLYQTNVLKLTRKGIGK